MLLKFYPNQTAPAEMTPEEISRLPSWQRRRRMFAANERANSVLRGDGYTSDRVYTGLQDALNAAANQSEPYYIVIRPGRDALVKLGDPVASMADLRAEKDTIQASLTVAMDTLMRFRGEIAHLRDQSITDYGQPAEGIKAVALGLLPEDLRRSAHAIRLTHQTQADGTYLLRASRGDQVVSRVVPAREEAASVAAAMMRELLTETEVPPPRARWGHSPSTERLALERLVSDDWARATAMGLRLYRYREQYIPAAAPLWLKLTAASGDSIVRRVGRGHETTGVAVTMMRDMLARAEHPVSAQASDPDPGVTRTVGLPPLVSDDQTDPV